MSTKVKVKFVRDFRSAATSERFYPCGSVGEFSDPDAAKILAEGAAVKAGPLDKVTGPDPLADLSGGELRGRAEAAVRNRRIARREWQ